MLHASGTQSLHLKSPHSYIIVKTLQNGTYLASNDVSILTQVLSVTNAPEVGSYLHSSVSQYPRPITKAPST
jgi:hypothetical protein